MPDIKGSKTEKNLMEAFAGESQARNKYTYFASVAKKEGYEKIAAIFQETADNEKEHAKLHLKHLAGIGSTIDNLRASAAGELDEHSDMYPRMAREAREEGFAEIAALFEGIAAIEKAHQERFLKLLAEVEAQTFFAKGETVRWRCRNCGHLHQSTEAPKCCPVCNHPQAYFELVEDHY
ncbi:rubrerythrin family protein [Geomonas sp. RF6]|uniref:rubrerythrin n=1 Tax=Geomonas sp. RF6 TaxID=2897342 RepID=UPI001E5B14DE|nr:rubrerythrin family protein [Geomonas sp. RF6]UFS70346.1 rubrerythrin family protein [Geomonas sp. RF6]